MGPRLIHGTLATQATTHHPNKTRLLLHHGDVSFPHVDKLTDKTHGGPYTPVQSMPPSKLNQSTRRAKANIATLHHGCLAHTSRLSM